MTKIALALDLGGTNLRIAAVGQDGTIYSRQKLESPRSPSGSEIVRSLTNSLIEFRSHLGSELSVAVISAAVPATIDGRHGVLTKVPNIPELDGFPLAHELSQALTSPAFLENDATAATIGENWLGASKGVANCIGITLGTGVGGGLIISGSPYRGIDGTAGEVGHVCVEAEGIVCGCGGRGCLEQYASAIAVVRLATEAGLKAVSSLDVHRQAMAGDGLAIEVFRKMGYYLGIGIASLVNVLNPEMIVVGGGVSAAFDLFDPWVLEQLSLRAFDQPAARVRIVRAKLGDDAGILGAARSAFTQMPNL